MKTISKLILHGKEYNVYGSGGSFSIFAGAVPDWSAQETLVWGESYTADRDGFVLVSITTIASEGFFTICGNEIKLGGYDSGDGGGDSLCVPVTVGDTYSTRGGYQSICQYLFVPVKVKTEAVSNVPTAICKPDWGNRQTIAQLADFTCPSTGYIYWSPTGDTVVPGNSLDVSTSVGGYILINGKPVLTCTYASGNDSSHADSAFFTVGKGDVVYSRMDFGSTYFIPAALSAVAGDITLDVNDFITKSDPTLNNSRIVTEATVPAATQSTLGGVMLEWDQSTNTLNIKLS